VCSFIVLVFTLSLHVSAYMSIFLRIRKGKKRKKTTQEQNTNPKHAERDHVKKDSEAESF
jgi:hypothetical protein